MGKKYNKSLQDMIENPLVEKHYRDLKQYYITNNNDNEADAIEDLIKYRFHENNNTSPNS